MRKLLAVLAVLAATSCATADQKRPTDDDKPAAAASELRRLREVLRPLPVVEGERFDAFIARARAAFSADDDPAVQRAANELPDDVGALLGPQASPARARVGAVLLGAWARSRSQEARQEALLSLIRHPTYNPSGVAVPGRTPAFDAFEADLKARAEALGLAFDHVDHVAYEVGPKVPAGRPAPPAVGVLVHADVVPASEPGWEVEPFAGVRKDDALWGRGALDDKGPLVAALFAIAALADSGAPLARRPLLIVGTSEETHWEGIERYQQERGLPEALFVADGAFPVGVGEKGIATVRVSAPPPTGTAASGGRPRLSHLEGGEVANQVPATASARLALPDPAAAGDLRERLEGAAAALEGANLSVLEHEGGLALTASGSAAHGSTPEEGHNAISDLVRVLVRQGGLQPSPCTTLLGAVDELVGTGTSPAALGVPDAHPRFSPASVNVGTLHMDEEGGCTVALDLRWPPPRGADEVVASVEEALRSALEQAAGGPFPLEVKGGGLDPFLVQEESGVIGALVESYEVVTGEEGAPVTLSGTTYAKAAPGSVTFGPGKEGQEGRIHAANERISLEELDELTELYALALARLTQGG